MKLAIILLLGTEGWSAWWNATGLQTGGGGEGGGWQGGCMLGLKQQEDGVDQRQGEVKGQRQRVKKKRGACRSFICMYKYVHLNAGHLNRATLGLCLFMQVSVYNELVAFRIQRTSICVQCNKTLWHDRASMRQEGVRGRGWGGEAGEWSHLWVVGKT